MARPKLAHLARTYKRDRRGRFAHDPSSPASPTKRQGKDLEAHLREYFGGQLHIADRDNPRVRELMADIDAIPNNHKKIIARWMSAQQGGGIHLSADPMMLGVLNNSGRHDLYSRYRNDPNARQAVGMAFLDERLVAIGTERNNISKAVGRHEMGHALDNALNVPSLDERYPFYGMVRRAQMAGRLAPYFAEGPRGVREAFAEGYTLWLLHQDADDRSLRIARGLGFPTGSQVDDVFAGRFGDQMGAFFDTLA